MIGRFMGAVELSEMKQVNKQVCLVVIPLAGVSCCCGWLRARPWRPCAGARDAPVFALWQEKFFQPTGECSGSTCLSSACAGCCSSLGKGLSARTLSIFSSTVVVLLLSGDPRWAARVAMWCVVAVGLFTSIGWSNTFSLALEGTGVLKSQVSSLLVMAILGGAVLPPVQGLDCRCDQQSADSRSSCL